jgi:hypothetical protein
MTATTLLGIGTAAELPPTAAASAAASPAPATCSPWSVALQGPYGSLSAVTALGTSDIWAVGNRHAPGTDTYAPLAEHWNGSTWRALPTPDPSSLDAVLSSVVAVSASDVWAVGFFEDSHTFRSLVEHWNGSSWKVVASPNAGGGENILSGTAAVGARDVWAVGTAQAAPGSPRRTLAEHWNGSSWKVVATPNIGPGDNLLQAVTATGSSNAWAVGDTNTNYTSALAIHWNGRSWQTVPAVNPGAGDRFLFGVTVPTARAARAAPATPEPVFAVGSFLTAKVRTKTLAERYDASTKTWQRVGTPSPGADFSQLWAVAARTSTDGWAVGSQRPTPGSPYRVLVAHWNGTRWNARSAVNPSAGWDELFGVALIPATPSYVAVGDAGPRTLVERYCAA